MKESKEGRELDRIQILRWAIEIGNGLQYAFDNGFSHGELSSNMIFIDEEDRTHIAGLNTPLAKYRTIQTTKTFRDIQLDTIEKSKEGGADPNFVAQLVGSMEALGEDVLNMVAESSLSVDYPLPSVTIQAMRKDIHDLGIIWLEMASAHILGENEDILKLILQVNHKWQSPLKLLLLEQGITNIIQLRGNIYIYIYLYNSNTT